MDWRQLERWATIETIALYAAAIVSLIILLGESLLPEGSPARQIFHSIANRLRRLGDIGSGVIIVIILLVLAGGGTVMLILKAIDKYQENRERRTRERAELKAAALAQGRAEERAAIQAKLREQGIDLDELLPPQAPEPPETT